MSRFIVQAILYPQMRREVDMNKVRMRRRHKTSIRMLRKKSAKNKNDDGEVTESSEDQEEEEEDYDDEQTETDESLGSTASNPFGLVHYFTGKRHSGGDRDRTEYETFIDHCDCTKDVFEAVAKAKTDELKVVRDSKGNLCFTHFKDLEKIDDGLRDSMPYGSTAVRLQEQSRSNSRDMVHTTTAQIRINQLQEQPSEQLSSFDQGTSREANFEDLSKLDDSMPMKMGRRQRTILEERHSMPTLFVGNRFNSVSATKIYIPSWKDRQDIQNSVTNCAEVGIESVNSARSGPPLSHSSSVDVPCDRVLPIPDKVVVELLYNINESQSSVENEIFTPPRMFKNDTTPTLSRDVSPFAKHNLNSDKRVSSTSSTASNPSAAEKQKRNSRRCLTYQYVELHSASSDKTTRSTSDTHQNTTSGTSARSSDSGMAGSYTLPSPDPPKVADEFFYAYEFDHMPVDAADQAGTSRDPPTGLKHSQSTHNLGRVNMIVASREIDIDNDDPGDVTDSGQYGDEGSLMKDFNEKYPYFNYEEPSISRGRTATRGAEHTNRSRSVGQHRLSNFTDTIVINIGSPSVNMIRLGGAHAPSVEKSGGREDEASLESGKEIVYRTGLYAHWWKKEKLPNALIKELMLKPNHGHGKSKKPCRRHPKHNQSKSIMGEEGASKSVSKSCQTSVSPPLAAVVAVNVDAKGSGKQRLMLWIGCD